MVYNWGHVIQKDNEKLDQEFKLLKKQLAKVKNIGVVKRHVGEFLTKYMKIGEDPTDTVIRDKVWERLRRLTKSKITEEELDELWIAKTTSQNTFCTIQ